MYVYIYSEYIYMHLIYTALDSIPDKTKTLTFSLEISS